MRITTFTIASFTIIHAIHFSDAWAQTHTIKPNTFTLTDDLRQAASVHLSQQNLQASSNSIDFNADHIKPTNISHPDWHTSKDDGPCFVVNEIDFVIDDPKMMRGNLSNLLTPLLDWQKPTYALGRCINNHNLSIIIDIAHNELLKRGYLTSSITVDEQDLLTQKLILTVKLGKVQDIVLTDSQKTPFYIYSAIPIKPNQALRLSDLEQGLDTLKRIDPKATAQIMPSDSNRFTSDITHSNKSSPGLSDLVINMNRHQSAVFGVNIDNSLSKSYGKYLTTASIRANNLLRINDEWQISVNYPLVRLADMIQNNLGTQINKDRQTNYHASLSSTHGLYKFSIAHSHHQYKHFIEGLNAPLTYHGTSQTSTIGLSRLMHRNSHQKTEGYIKANHKRSANYIDDVNIEVQNRRTTGYNLGIIYQHHFFKGGYLYANLDYKHGVGALKAMPAPEESIHDAFGRQMPSEGHAKAPIWSLHTSFQKPFNITVKHKGHIQDFNQNTHQTRSLSQTPILLSYTAKVQAQYAKQTPVPSDLFYLGGRNSIKGVKEGNYLSGEHGFSLSQEIAWRPSYIISQKLGMSSHNIQPYASIDQGYVYGQNTIKNQRYMLAGAIGLRYYFQRNTMPNKQNQGFGFKGNQLHPSASIDLNNQPATAYLDLFIGKSIKTPTFIKKETVIGVNAGFDF
ncbi:ShlB/FhaC/HecB family hemolysin secretion/activation protein [Moraxella oculi]|uniref:ShlB/FhaC/HecB family hemolysin secretion/activation protein n=1 Tax=Moraxella oculi TaxID=2940516 RepID=A0ABW8U700_9GAMM